MKRLISFGEILIDFVPTENGLTLADVPTFHKVPGGAPANVAVAVAKLGGNSFFVGKVGDDSFGHFLAETLKSQHVKTDYMLFTKEAKTALAFVSLKADGEREFLFYRDPSADMLFSEEEVENIHFQPDDILHICSNTLTYPVCKIATEYAVALAKEKGAWISFDPNIRLSLWKDEELARDSILNLLEFVDLLKVTEEELAFLFPGENENSAISLLMNYGIRLVIVTRGSMGSTYYTPYISNHIQGVKVSPIDTTGAGDGFIGGFLYQLSLTEVDWEQNGEGLLESKDRLDQMIEFANVCGAITVTGRGAIPSLPTKICVDRFRQKAI